MCFLVVSCAVRADADVVPLSGLFGVGRHLVEGLRKIRRAPDVAANGNGGFVIGWTGHAERPDLGSYAFERRFDANGNRVLHGVRYVSRSDTAGAIKLLELPNDHHLIVVTDRVGRDGESSGLFGGVFDQDGERLGKEFPVNLLGDGQQRDEGPRLLR